MIGKKTFGKLLVFLFGFGLLYYGCAGEKGTTTKNINELDPNTQQEVQSVSSDSLGEVSLLTETELNPVMLEASIQEVNLLTGRAPRLVGKDSESSIESESELKPELNFEESLTLYIGESEIEKIKKLKDVFDENVEKLGKRYASLIKDFLINLINLKNCYDRSWSCEKLKIGSSPIEISCSNVVVSSCKVGDYDVSGNFSVSATFTDNTNFSLQLTFNNLKFSKDNEKYVNFITGTISADVKPGNSIFRVKNIKIDDKEEGRYVSGSGERTINWSALDKSGNMLSSFDGTLTDYSSGKSYNFNGEISANLIKGSLLKSSFSLNLTADFGTIRVNGSHTREKGNNPKYLKKEMDFDVSYSSPSTQFSLSAYRYKYIQPASGGEFALAITNTLKINGQTVKAYSHNLTITKDTKDSRKFIISGETHIQKENGREIIVSFEKVILEKGCDRPTSGKMISSVKTKDGKTVKVEASFKSGCVCELDEVVVQKDNQNIVIKDFDICKAREETKSKIKMKISGSGGGDDDHMSNEDHMKDGHMQ